MASSSKISRARWGPLRDRRLDDHLRAQQSRFGRTGQQLAAGKRRLGIFYGAGHLPDMEKRLEKDFGLKRQSTTWLTAWDMTGRIRQAAGK